MRIQRKADNASPRPPVETRVSDAESERLERFVEVWRALHPGERSAALRALLQLGLDAAARPQMHGERWLDLDEQLIRMSTLLDALGIAVASLPAFVAWIVQHNHWSASEEQRAALAERLEGLMSLDWDERCRRRGIPRPRYTRAPRTRPIGDPPPRQAGRPWRTTVRLPSALRERVTGVALRDATSAHAALLRALTVGLDVLEGAAYGQPMERLLESTRRIQVQLDEIGAVAAGAPALAVHLWCRLEHRGHETEQAMLVELHDYARALWAHLLAGPEPAAAPKPDLDEEEP